MTWTGIVSINRRALGITMYPEAGGANRSLVVRQFITCFGAPDNQSPAAEFLFSRNWAKILRKRIQRSEK
jgi:hypothetical protein